MTCRAWRFVVAVAFAAAAFGSRADGAPVFDGYDAFYASLPSPLFNPADEKRLDDPQSFEGQSFRAWGTVPPDGVRPGGRAGHRIEILGVDMTIDDRALPASRARAFPGETGAEVGADARLYVGARDVCVQGVAPTSSGTAQRHVHVRLVTDAFTKRARRYDLPSLFGSCLAVYRTPAGGLQFLAARLNTPAGADTADGVVFDRWNLRNGAFARTGESTRAVFPDPGNVYRFRLAPP